MAYDWATDFATFLSAYGGRDPLDCTWAVFEALVGQARITRKWLDGDYDGGDENSATTELENRKIILRARMPDVYPDPLAGL